MKTRVNILPILLCLLPLGLFSQEKDSLRVYSDFAHPGPEGLFHDLHVYGNWDSLIDLDIKTFKYNQPGDSLLVMAKRLEKHQLKKGLNTISVHYNENSFIHSDFQRISKNHHLIPPASYVTYIKFGDTLSSYTITQFHTIDSLLPDHHALRKSFVSNLIKIKKGREVETELQRIAEKGKLQSKVFRKGSLIVADLFDGNWFIGRYQISAVQDLKKQLEQESKQLQQKIIDFQDGSIEQVESLYGKVRKLHEEEKKNAEVSGQFGISANLSNQQDPFSAADKNFYEIYGDLQTPVLGIPVSIEGYYTTQDIGRKVKSSYLRFHYDMESAKQKLMQLVGEYKSNYEESISRTKGFDHIYKGYVKDMGIKKDEAIYSFKKEANLQNTGFTNLNMNDIDTTAILIGMLAELDKDSSTRNNQSVYQQRKDSLMKVYQMAMQKYEEAKVWEKRVKQYQSKYEQYKNSKYFDSLTTYSKVKEFEDYENMSYKDLAKASSNLLPEGKVKRIATGLTNLDAGIFAKHTGKYGLSGQQMKGLDIGYDIGFATVNATYGRTEYIGRDGELDTYTCYNGLLTTKPIKGQKLLLNYYGYSPNRKMIQTNQEFFKNYSGSYPSFRSPVHIVSLGYEGKVAKSINLFGEMAYSNERKKEGSTPDWKKQLAWNIGSDGQIKGTNLSYELSYEQVGKDFTNNTLPINMAGTERLKVGAKNSCFKNFLHLGLEWNHMIQHNLNGMSRLNRWGFEVKTVSKQYPNLSLSYKPFATIRTLSDTLLTPQRPIVGGLWLAKATYQYKKQGHVWRFLFLLSQASSKMDTVSYNNNLIQGNISYMTKKYQYQLSIGQMQAKSNANEFIPAWYRSRSWMLNLSTQQSLTKTLQVQGGLDMLTAASQVYNLGGNAGFMYQFQKTPLRFRCSFRYNRYQIPESPNWNHRIGSIIDLTWQFKYKVYEKN